MNKPKEKYGDLNKILPQSDEGAEGDQAPKTRRRRVSPSVSLMTGDSKPRTVENLRLAKEEAEKKLEAQESKFAEEKQKLLSQIENLQDTAGTPEIYREMPVTGTRVKFSLRTVDPKLIDVSPENERLQEYLDEISLSDILPSIRKSKQQDPGTLRLKDDGRFELIEGSRRLAAVKIAKQQYLAFVGDIPDEDVRELSLIENKKQSVSPYEKAQAYQRRVDRGEFDNWASLGAFYEMSQAQIARYKALVELDEIFVRILPKPSDMPLTYAEKIKALREMNGEGLMEEARAILKERSRAVDDECEPPTVEVIMKRLKSSSKPKIKKPGNKKSVLYENKSKGVYMKHTISSKGTNRIEMDGIEDEKMAEIVRHITEMFGLKNG